MTRVDDGLTFAHTARFGGRMPIAPNASPLYTQHAVFPRAAELVSKLPEKPKAIASLIGKADDEQIVYRIQKGKNSAYLVVHRLYTHCCLRLGPEIPRSLAVLPVVGKDVSPKPDLELDNCRVFAGLQNVLTTHSIKLEALARKADIAPAYLEHMSAGMPVASNLVEMAFQAIQTMTKDALERALHIVP